MAKPRIRAHVAANLSAVEARHHVIQKDNIGPKPGGDPEGLLARRGRLEVKVSAQQLLHVCDIDRIVIDGQNLVSRLYHSTYVGQKPVSF
jgi:hypothetical protein